MNLLDVAALLDDQLYDSEVKYDVILTTLTNYTSFT